MGNYFFKSFRGKDVRILFMGLDAAGKTTILYRLKPGEVVTTVPTIGFNVETVTHKRMNLTAWDVGGRDKVRPLFRHYFHNTQALVYVIDSNDRERLEQSIDELVGFLGDDELRGVPIVIMANKQDLPTAMTPEDIYTAIRKSNPMTQRDWTVYGVSGLTGDGLFDCLDWLTIHITRKEKDKKEENVSKPKLSQDANINDNKHLKDVSKLSYFSDVIYTFGKMLMSK